MPKNKAPIEVTITKGAHKTQPFTYAIDKPGPGAKETKQERYATASNARRAAAKELSAVLVRIPSKITYKPYHYLSGGQEVVFINKATKPARKK